jgi:DNA-binding protein H-NS
MATLPEIEKRIAKLQLKAIELRRKQSAGIISNILRLMQDHGLTLADLEHAPKTGAKRRGRPPRNGAAVGVAGSPAKAAKAILPPRYRDPKTGATWSGHARPPAWIKDVGDRSKFLINPEEAASPKGVKAKAVTPAKASRAQKTAGVRRAARSATVKQAARKGPRRTKAA